MEKSKEAIAWSYYKPFLIILWATLCLKFLLSGLPTEFQIFHKICWTGASSSIDIRHSGRY